MTTTAALPPLQRPRLITVADLLESLGGVAPERVRFRPVPGTATEQDVLTAERQEDLLCELVDGVLVEKPMGFRESLLAAAIVGALRAFVIPRNLDLVTAPDGMLRLFPGAVRIPDVAFISWGRLPGGRIPTEPIPEVSPDLVAEVLSEGNTRAEMGRKRREYFASGSRVVWEFDPDTRTVSVYTSTEAPRVLTADQTLDGGAVLPGFAIPLETLFAELDRTQ